MGFQSSVNVWQWRGDLDAKLWEVEVAPESPVSQSSNPFYPYEEPAGFPDRKPNALSACEDLVAERPGTVTVRDTTNVTGRGQWRDGVWRVVVTRPLKTGGSAGDVQLGAGDVHVAFAAWDGDEGDRGSRKSISDWVILHQQ